MLIQSLAHETSVLERGLMYLDGVLKSLEPLHHPLGTPGGSVLLRELVNAPNISEAPQSAQATPLLHAMASAHAYVTMFVHVCRVGQVSGSMFYCNIILMGHCKGISPPPKKKRQMFLDETDPDVHTNL